MRSRSVLLAGVPISPTKALSPSHLKGLITLDVCLRATSLVERVTYHNNRIATDATLQVIGFWEYLDSRFGAPSVEFYRDKCDSWFSERYVEANREQRRICDERLRAHRLRMEAEPWLHPSSARLLSCWQEQLSNLRIRAGDPWEWKALRGTREEFLERLARHDVLLDMRDVGGGVLIDLTREGIPVRQLVSPQGHENYLYYMLRTLADASDGHDLVVLAYDEQLRADYLLISRILTRFGVPNAHLCVTRVPLDGSTKSARHGMPSEYGITAIRERFRGHSDDALALGLKTYLVLHHHAGAFGFDFGILGRHVRRAESLLARGAGEPDADACAPLLRRMIKGRGYVSPYRFTSAMLSLGGAALRALLREVFL